MLGKHPQFSYRVECVGHDAQPVLIVDNFLAEPELLIDEASNLEFIAAGAMYPGVRAPASALYLQALYNFIRPLMAQVFGINEAQVRSIESYYSMVVTPPSDLTPMQCFPHIDSAYSQELASIYYLCPETMGGTSLYRHKDTGFEYIDNQRMQTYVNSINQSTRDRQFEKSYMNGSNELFEQIVSYESCFNRFVMYRCTSLHSGNIAKDFEFNPDPRKGRLTLNTFIGCHRT